MDRPNSSRADSGQSRESEAIKYYQESFCSNAANDFMQDLDQPDILESLLQKLSSSNSRNFILDFSDNDAYVRLDLPTASIIDLLTAGPRPNELGTRWINIWYPFDHRSLLEAIAKHYDFSPRLLAMMCSDPRQSKHGRSSASTKGTSLRRASSLASGHKPSQDLEKGNVLSDLASISSNNPVRTGNIYDIANEVWHYTSVDQGRNYLCLGYNSIYNTGAVELPQDGAPYVSKPPLPHCKRVWTWLLLCRDRTVITINEDPLPYSDGNSTKQEQGILVETRRNLINVFRSLSLVEEPASTSPLTLLPIRKRLGNTEEETAHRMQDAPGMLFYYLFENWFNSYSLVTRRDSRYGVLLEGVRANMFQQPKLSHIDHLDQIGSQLGVLKRHYKSYIRIIDRVIEPPVATLASLDSSQILRDSSEGTFESSNDKAIRPTTVANSLLGMSLSSAARVRFERLKDLIYLYALSEVKDYIEQKDSLTQMNFQLIAIKESKDVERLTRVSLLITKATILFLPVSFMTAYFSTDLNQQYTITTYWVAFAVVFFLSWVFLLGFGVLSGSMESWRIFTLVRDRYKQIKDHRKRQD